MNWRVSAAVAALCLFGCALTPNEIMERGVRQTASSRLAPRDVANCIGKNAEHVTRLGETLAYPTGRRGFEVLLHYPDIGPVAVFSIGSTGTGSLITGWVAPNLPAPELVFGNLVWGC